jgi:hypothetical protein
VADAAAQRPRGDRRFGPIGITIEWQGKKLRIAGVPTMDYQTLREWIDAKPFEPFRLVMTDGRAFEITHPNLIWPARNNVLVGMPDNPDEPEVPARHCTVAMIHIVRIEPLTAAPAPSRP